MPARPLGRAVIGAAFRIDGRLVAREAFYAAACDPQRSVVVQACAGAGKTWMLVSRIVRALLAGAEPHEILAITFTRRAAGEMRDRLDEWLAEFASPATSDAERTRALRERGLDEAAALAAAPHLQALHERVLRGGRPVEIRTFHAWFSQLLRAAPLELLNELGLQADMAPTVASNKTRICQRPNRVKVMIRSWDIRSNSTTRLNIESPRYRNRTCLELPLADYESAA